MEVEYDVNLNQIVINVKICGITVLLKSLNYFAVTLIGLQMQNYV